MLIASPSALGQVLTNTSDGTLSAVVSFEVLMPGKSQIPAGEQLRFRVRSNSASGYRVEASASFSSSASAPVAGGASISASDIGIGITVVDTSAPGVLKPRLDAIAPGFNYNPEDFIATNGLTPYQGRSGGVKELPSRLLSVSAACCLPMPLLLKPVVWEFIRVVSSSRFSRDRRKPSHFKSKPPRQISRYAGASR